MNICAECVVEYFGDKTEIGLGRKMRLNYCCLCHKLKPTVKLKHWQEMLIRESVVDRIQKVER